MGVGRVTRDYWGIRIVSAYDGSTNILVNSDGNDRNKKNYLLITAMLEMRKTKFVVTTMELVQL